MIKTIITNNVEETKALGAAIATILVEGSIVTLDGDLGAGKTQFAKGLAKQLGVNRVVNSPTFTIMKQYQGDKYLVNHLDVYRLDGIGFDFDLEEYIYSDAISVIEWSENIKEIFDDNRIIINIKVIGETKREFTIIYNETNYNLEKIL